MQIRKIKRMESNLLDEMPKCVLIEKKVIINMIMSYLGYQQNNANLLYKKWRNNGKIIKTEQGLIIKS